MPGSSLLARRVLVALLLGAAAWVAVGGSLTGVATATPAVHPTATAAVAVPAGLPAVVATSAAAKPGLATPVNVRHYTVRAGDCLSVIAARYRYPGGWPALYAHNRGTVGQDPDLIHPGQRLRLLLGQPAPRRSPTPGPAAVTVPKAAAGGAAHPVAPATRPSGLDAAPAPAPRPTPEPAQPTSQPAPSSWLAALGWVAVALGVLFAFGLVLAAVAGDPQPGRRHRPPVAPTPPAPDPAPGPVTPTCHPPARPGPTTTNGDADPVSFSLVAVATGQGGAELAALLARLTALEDQRLGLVVVVGQDDHGGLAAAQAARRQLPGRVTVVSDPQQPASLADAIDRALPACQGEVTGVLAAGPIHPQLLDRVAGHVRRDGASMVWAGTGSAVCRWSTSTPPGRLRLRLVPLAGLHVFVRTELLQPQTGQDGELATGQPATGRHGQPAEARPHRVSVQLHPCGHQATPDNQPPILDQPRRSGAM